MKKIIWGIALLFCTSMAANAHTNCQNSYKCATQKSSCKRGITYRPDVIHYDYDRRKARFYDSTPRRVLHLLP